eukprot:TRINITY_DN496_c0_g1_i1.p1 TRINITY_DN496_c0_g1~~TRINITY_DN496_c0_g1_i1.p1  ORF type:complete len:166 (+),score=89.66 TRINITY_DN496_c0_g1_i1:58-498(+)
MKTATLLVIALVVCVVSCAELDGKAFLAQKAAEEGVHATGSGLLYKVIKEGTGARPPNGQSLVSVHYRGTLIDGTEFDSSYKRGSPAEFRLSQVIPGWTEALQLMNTGSTFEVYLPPEIAYGSRKVGNLIPANSVLVFQIELLAIL